MESFPLPSAWSFSVVCGFLSRAVGGRRVGVVSASLEADSGGAKGPAHRYVPGHSWLHSEPVGETQCSANTMEEFSLEAVQGT